MPFGKTPKIPAPAAQPRMPIRVEPEIDKAVLDEQERRKRVGMNRELSRLSMPSLQKPVGQAGFSKTL